MGHWSTGLKVDVWVNVEKNKKYICMYIYNVYIFFYIYIWKNTFFKKKNHFCTFLNGMFMSDFFKNQLNGLGTLRGKVTHCFLYPEFTQ